MTPLKDIPRITAVIVTYHNPAMLENLLDNLLGQSLNLHEIIVIDNSVDDRTAEMIGTGFPGIVYRRMSENSGSAGGFHEGIRMAVGKADYVLTLDDDVRMSSEAVANLHAGMKLRESQGTSVGAVRATGASHPCEMPAELRDFAWRGTLLSRVAIEHAGLPVREYFLYADDLEYSVRLAEAGFRFFWAPSSVIEEMRKEDKVPHRLFGRRFFLYRENFRFYYALRNQIHAYRVHRRYGDLLRTVRYGTKMIAYFVLFSRGECQGRVKAILSGMADGFRSRLGRNGCYLPAGDALSSPDGGNGRCEDPVRDPGSGREKRIL
jgi:rhamnopyranosyl-N-acetylglucosaminyl-diphospho-decaprenol beta-1,3/1,4-galactofuranosyltransferase